MTLAEPQLEFNQESKQFYAEKLSPKKEVNPGGDHEQFGGLTCVVSTNTSEETVTSVSCEELDVNIVDIEDHIILQSTTDDDDDEDPNATEHSSSFSDTASETEMFNGLTEGEVESHYWDNPDLGPAYDSFGSIFHFRKKRLTDHWRSFVRPLMWRSKWVELRIRELESRALEYPRELESHEQEKHGAIDESMLEACDGIKSLPFSNPMYRKRAAKRRKRKKVESTEDIASYMSSHNLFSYFEAKRLSSEGIAMADDFGVAKDQRIDSKNKVELDEENSVFEHREGDSIIEEVLWKIELVHSQVHKLKSQIDVITSKNAAKFSSSENLSLLAASSAPSPTISAGTGDMISIGAIYNSSQHMPDYVLGDLVFSEGAISSYGDGFHIPDIIESTVGLFADADVTLHHSHIGDSCEDILDNILIGNGMVEELNPNLVETTCEIQLKQETDEIEKSEEGEGTSTPLLQHKEEEEEMIAVVKNKDSVLRSCLASEMLVPRNKRTRGGERKASSWSKKHLSDPESQ